MKTFPYQTIQHFHGARENQKVDRLRLRFLFGTLLPVVIVTAVVAVSNRDRALKTPQAILIEGSRLSLPDNKRGDEDLWNAWSQAAKAASDLWTKEGVRVPRIGMFADKDACLPNGTAAANMEKHAIYVCKDGDGVDRVSVMMHEIGHILGVPHIAGDPLMDPAYQGALNAPSQDAVAIAKEKQRWTIMDASPSKHPAP